VSAPGLPRFKVSSVTGYALNAGGKRMATAYFVLDTWDLHRIVSSWLPHDGKTAGTANMISNGDRRRERAEQRCAELEAWHHAEMAKP